MTFTLSLYIFYKILINTKRRFYIKILRRVFLNDMHLRNTSIYFKNLNFNRFLNNSDR